MHSQDYEFDGEGNPRHITEINFFRSDATDFIDNAIKNISRVLTSPESALLISTLYDRKHGLTKDTIEDDINGAVLYREEEDSISCTRMDTLVQKYLVYDIKKFFGYTLTEFTDLTSIEMDSVIRYARKEKLKLTTEMEEIENMVEET